MDMIKVSANSCTAAVVGEIPGVIREYKHAEVQAIGAGTVNQAAKAVVLATSYLKDNGINVTCVPNLPMSQL
jgi:stage V sporulation protein S